MKNIQLIITVLIAGAIAITGCSKNNDPTASMNGSINSSAFSAIGNRVQTTGTPGTLTTITGANLPTPNNTTPTAISITVYNEANTYKFDTVRGNKQVTAFLSSSATHGVLEATAGRVVVTGSTAHTVQGTFNLTFRDGNTVYTINDGQFTGTY